MLPRVHVFALLLLTLVVGLPLLMVLASWLQWNALSADVLVQMWGTVLPDYAWTTFGLCVLVALGVTALGLGAAVAVTLFDFAGRRWFEWLMLLPMAMPAYVLAYAYTDFFQYSGPAQTWLRGQAWCQGCVLPDVRSLWGAAMVLTFALYPYVYLLARTALAERGAHLMEAARTLSASLPQRMWRVAIPLARPAVAAGVALALMETLADFGVSSYFGIQTFSAGIYKAWLVMDDRIAAAQLATVLMLLVLLVQHLEHRAERRMRFASSRGGRAAHAPTPTRGLGLLVLWGLCGVPVLVGFVLPVLFMLRPLLGEEVVVPWGRFGQWAWNSVSLAGLTVLLALAMAVFLATVARQWGGRVVRAVLALVGLGYAIPGPVIVVGLLLPLAWLQTVAPSLQAGYWLTATVLGLLWAYLVRFCGVALQAVQSGYARIPGNLDDSARMLGVSGLALTRRVHWPLLQRSTAAAALLVFVDVMKELPATLVLRPFDSDTLAVMAYQLARDERLGEAALPSLALVAVGLLPVIVLSRTLSRR